MELSQKQIVAFQKKILDWYEENKRDLPWRKTQDPYKILVSEVMLQQTQVSRVIPKYEAWLKAFPKTEDLANASTREVLALWSGLGYNRRALYLQKTAQMLCEARIPTLPRLRGASKNQELRIKEAAQYYWPRTIDELKKMPGVGEYTASAVACFAFNEQVAVVDTNVRRVILTQFPMSNAQYQMSNRDLQMIADQLPPRGRARDWNQALMDYAASVLKKEKIPQVKQSRFLGSDRFYRGRIIKILLQNEFLSVMSLGKAVKDNFSSLDRSWLEVIIDKMVKEEILINENGNISLKS